MPMQDKKNYYKAAVAGKPARRSRRWRERRFPKPQDYTRVVNAAHHLHAHKNRRQDITLSTDMRTTRIMVQQHRITAKPLHVNGTLRGRRFPMQRAFLNSYPPAGRAERIEPQRRDQSPRMRTWTNRLAVVSPTAEMGRSQPPRTAMRNVDKNPNAAKRAAGARHA